MSTDYFLVVGRKMIQIAQDGLSGFTLCRGEVQTSPRRRSL